MTGAKIEIRKCRGIEEKKACVQLQKEVWGFSDADLIPLRMFVVAEKIGGQVIGAFDGNELIGFTLSIPGSHEGHPYLHSHMLAVREQYRNFGLGRKLKLAQRDDALERGFDLMEWTFDPLEIKNAHLNIVKLGAIARRYSVNQYGISSSPLHGGLPTDRLIAEWWLRSKRVSDVLQGIAPLIDVQTTIGVPFEINQWKASPAQREKAEAVQLRNRAEFQRAFSDGFAVLGYERDARSNGKFLLGRWDDPWSFATGEAKP